MIKRMLKKENHKSQMEMFGLTLIVILIIIGFFIFVSFRQKIPISDYKKSYVADETSSNFINSVVNVNPIECMGTDYTLSDMLKFCARGDSIDCSGSTNPCAIANKTLWIIANKTLVKQGIGFILYTQGISWNNKEIIIKNANCTGREMGQRGTIPISLYPVPGNIYLNLDICK